ncbi:hypothetical protein D3C84_821930 [compost metagenome]
MNELQTLLNLVYEHLIGRVEGEPSCSHHDEFELQQRIAQLTRPNDFKKPIPDDKPCLDGAAYPLSVNPHGLDPAPARSRYLCSMA